VGSYCIVTRTTRRLSIELTRRLRSRGAVLSSAPAALDVHPGRGSSWEAFVIDQVITACQRVRPSTRAFFWRTARGQEVDLLLDIGTRQIPIEIRLRSVPTTDDALAVRACMEDLGLARGYVIYPGREAYSLGQHVTALPADQLLKDPKSILRL
jgi:hypothetical protein